MTWWQICLNLPRIDGIVWSDKSIGKYIYGIYKTCENQKFVIESRGKAGNFIIIRFISSYFAFYTPFFYGVYKRIIDLVYYRCVTNYLMTKMFITKLYLCAVQHIIYVNQSYWRFSLIQSINIKLLPDWLTNWHIRKPFGHIGCLWIELKMS